LAETILQLFELPFIVQLIAFIVSRFVDIDAACVFTWCNVCDKFYLYYTMLINDILLRWKDKFSSCFVVNVFMWWMSCVSLLCF